MIRKDGSLKCADAVFGEPILKYVLESRSWHKQNLVKRYYFILYDVPEARAFGKVLQEWFPRSSITYIPQYVAGAALTVLSSIPNVIGEDTPVIVDLADIYYKTPIDFNVSKVMRSGVNTVAFTFYSQDKIYSYLKFDKDNSFQEAREKSVISYHASAGTYVFDNADTYIQALAWYRMNGSDYKYNGLYYVCPMLNGVKYNGKKVKKVDVFEASSLK